MPNPCPAMRQTAPASMSSLVNAPNKRTITLDLTLSFSPSRLHIPPSLLYNPPAYLATMSFEVTATIANFGGKLLKLAHQVNIHQNGYPDSYQVLTQ